MKKCGVLLICLLMAGVALFPVDNKFEEKLMYSVGHFGACFLYQTYSSIGMTADAWTDKSMEPDRAKAILQEDITFLDVSAKVLGDLKKFPLAESDLSAMQEMLSIIRDLKTEAENMLLYINDRKQENATKYNNARLQAWDKIKQLMGIK